VSSRAAREEKPLDQETVIGWVKISHGALRKAYQAVVGLGIAMNNEEVAVSAKRCMELLTEIEHENEKIVAGLKR
jgi:hypothetical protein